jgi:hypothetical protein
MQPRAVVTDVVRVVARQHTRMRGLVCEVAQATGAERQAAAGWLAHYVVLHTAAERLGLGREPSAVVQQVVPRHGQLVGLMIGLTATAPLDESEVCRCASVLEEAVVRHARAQERAILPRLLASWRPADLWHAAAAFEAADLVFDQGPPTPPAASASPAASSSPTAPLALSPQPDPWSPEVTEALWRDAVADIARLLTSPADDPAQLVGPTTAARRTSQAPAAPTAMATAATAAVTTTARVTTAVRRT